MGRFDPLYNRLPLWAQHCAVSVYGGYRYWLRFGPGFRQYVVDYRARERFSGEEWDRWQNRRLRRLLEICATRVPHYQRNWTGAQKVAAAAGDLSALPLLEKDPIRANPEQFLDPQAAPRMKHVFHTSGSTGTPIASIWNTQEIRNSRALREARSANWAGVSFSMPRATFSGRMVEPDPDSKGPFYRFNLFERQVYFSAFHLRADTARAYVDALHRHGIKWLTGYAVSYYLLAKFMLEQDIKPPELRALITTSEKVSPAMRAVMEKAYRCKVYEEYSTVETALFAAECAYGRLHVSPDVAVVEILRPDGSPCEPGEPGEVVATGLLHDYQLFVRYRLGDVAAWDARRCPCGRQMPVLKEVVGRIEDVVIGSDGRQMVRFHGVFIDQPHIREGQVIQEALDRIRVKIVPTDGFGPDDVRSVENSVQTRLGDQVTVVVETVEHIPRTAAGKFQAVVSLLDKDAVHGVERTGG